MKHKHHIIPKHMGGTDDPSNLIELSVEEHAEAHRVLWEQHGKMQDYYAWKGLSSAIGKEEIRLNLCRLGGHISGRKNLLNLSEESKRKRVETRKNRPCGYNTPEHMARMLEKSKDVECIERRKKVYAERGHQQGTKNSCYGTMWITNGADNKKIKKEDLDKWLEMGYYKGRIMRA